MIRTTQEGKPRKRKEGLQDVVTVKGRIYRSTSHCNRYNGHGRGSGAADARPERWRWIIHDAEHNRPSLAATPVSRPYPKTTPEPASAKLPVQMPTLGDTSWCPLSPGLSLVVSPNASVFDSPAENQRSRRTSRVNAVDFACRSYSQWTVFTFPSKIMFKIERIIVVKLY